MRKHRYCDKRTIERGQKGEWNGMLDVEVPCPEQRNNLRVRLKEGAIRRADRDRHTVEEWFSVDEEAWEKSET